VWSTTACGWEKTPRFRTSTGYAKNWSMRCAKIKPPVVRFPGGCFADSYDWKDGIGPTEKRPKRTNFWAEGESASAPPNHKYDPKPVRNQ